MILSALLLPVLLGTLVLGLAVGSFTNVVVSRVPAGRSVVAPRSACPTCETPISSRDNVPVLSWLLLRGRCRTCKTSISSRYPLVELAGGVTFAAVAVWRLVTAGPVITGMDAGALALEIAALLYLASITIALALIDIDVHRLPDVIVLPGYAVGAVLLCGAAFLHGDLEAAARAAAGAGALVVFYFGLAMVKAGGMGLGDIKLAGVLGLFLAYFGWPQLIVGTSAAFLVGGLVGLALIIARRVGRGGGIPFGPAMLAGAWIGIVAGAPLADAYLSLVGLR